MTRENHVHFGNDATYHVYSWLVASKAVNTEGMVRQAFNRATEEKPDMIEFSTLHTVQEKLAEDLQGWFEERPWQDACEAFECYAGPDDCIPGDFSLAGIGVTEALLMPLLAMSVNEIRWYAIAEALLRDAGKWNPPDVEIPEIL